MTRLDRTARDSLPDSAFAYVDSRGRRRLPINDEAHVRNALGRFSQVRFESEAAKERARKRLLKAAKKYGIVPIGFITSQLESERMNTTPRAESLPTGLLTLLMTDIESSTALLRRIGDRYRDLLRDARSIMRRSVRRAGGHVVDARADDFFAVFDAAGPAVEAAADFQRRIGSHEWPDKLEVRVRAGLHTGCPTLTDVGYIGIAVHTAARICSAAHGGQILISGATHAALGSALPDGIQFRDLGRHELEGLSEAETLFQVMADALIATFPPPATASSDADPSDSGTTG